MSEKRDIQNRTDIEQLIAQFYEKVKVDDTIGFIFNDVITMDWEKHIPIIVDFWETILLDNPVYGKNAMEKHYDLNKITPLTKIHFDRWLQLFTTTVDELFSGEKAELAKKRAVGIANVMEFKISEINKR